MAKDVTLADIAAEVGVSTVAVSKALSGKTGVSEELRNKIKFVAKQMGYVPTSSSRASSAATGNIGVIVPENFYGLSASFYGYFYEKVVKALYHNGYYGILELLTKTDEIRGNLPRVMQEEKVDGLIFLGQIDEKYIDKIIEQSKVPVFFLDTYVPCKNMDTVISDRYYGMYFMTNYLISQGHRKIGFLGSVDATSSIADRYWGYRRALRENHIDYKEEWEIPDRDENGKCFESISDLPEGMDAYVCNSDLAAFYLIRSLERTGYRVPEDISVVGFDNFLPIGIDMENAEITSYAVDADRMAEVCVESLINKLKHREYTEGIQIVPGKMVLKKTVKRKN